MIIVQGIFIPFFAAAKPQVTAEIKQVVLREIGAKWGKFSEQDLSALKGNDDLVTQVVATSGVEKAFGRPRNLSTGNGDGRRQKWLHVIQLMPRSRSITKPWLSYFRLE